ncbi:META domain-containing protein [Deinococcus sedimenti]|uniref:DUF306 domain-containing protein n=1 Tax=Deinococcus sedimenti TaxID=1867090 RepID=A0ABQ2S2B0_9DEIO|nr:META domain-containing protein [Deinococcus sedimenti]GGR91087.1 hypothetical protein GCM10008960_17690 [Deinococcus sedimenti]
MFRLLPLALLTALSTTTAATPAPLHGIWQLTGFSVNGHAIATPDTTLFISGERVSGRLGCGSYEGRLNVERGTVQMQVGPDAPAPTVRCLYAQPGAYHAALNAVTGYAITRDTQDLVLFSKQGRLTFTRIGYVTPAKK